MFKKQGFSLIELMIALSLSTGLIVGSIAVYTQTTAFYHFLIELSDVNQKVRSLTWVLRPLLSQIGYLGCRSRSLHPRQLILEGHNDSLSFLYLDPIVPLKKAVSNSNRLVFSKNYRFNKGDILLLNNCQSLKFTKIKQITLRHSEQQVELETTLTEAYPAELEVGVLNEMTLFLKKPPKNAPDKKASYRLALAINQKVDDLMDGIRSFQVLYANTPCFPKAKRIYLPAESIQEWNNVCFIRLIFDFFLETKGLSRSFHLDIPLKNRL